VELGEIEEKAGDKEKQEPEAGHPHFEKQGFRMPYSGSFDASHVKRRHSEAFRSRMKTKEDFAARTPWQKSKFGKSALRRSYWTFVTLAGLGLVGAILINV
jgi:hypothetical protein